MEIIIDAIIYLSAGAALGYVVGKFFENMYEKNLPKAGPYTGPENIDFSNVEFTRHMSVDTALELTEKHIF